MCSTIKSLLNSQIFFLFSWLWCLNQGWYCLEKLDAYHSSVRCLSFLVKGLTIRMKHNVLTLLDMSSDREEYYTKDESFINISSDTERDEYEWKMIRSGKPKGVGSRGVLVCLFAFFHYLSNTNILVTTGLCVTIQVKDFIFFCVANFWAYLGCIVKTIVFSEVQFSPPLPSPPSSYLDLPAGVIGMKILRKRAKKQI